MDRKSFEFSVKNSKNLKDSIKESCYYIRECLQNYNHNQNDIITLLNNSAVSEKEFIEAVRILMEYYA